MNLYVPQWQGAGASRAIAAGAARVRAACDVPLVEITPFSDAASATEHAIQNYRSVVANLEAMRALLDAERPRRVTVVGGDCGVDAVAIGYLAERYGDELGVVWIDAHADLNTPASSPSKTFHGMALRAAMGDGDVRIEDCVRPFVTPSQVVLAGVRELDPEESAVIAEREIRRCGVEAIEVPRRKLYVHVDLDVLEPTQFAGVACPTADGVAPAVLRSCIKRLVRDHEVVGGSVLEYVGERADETAFAAALVQLLADQHA
jgi:arginase